jgi:hypothetical protein
LLRVGGGLYIRRALDEQNLVFGQTLILHKNLLGRFF